MLTNTLRMVPAHSVLQYRASLAVEEAAAAIAVDPSWPKGFYYKAVALEELGDLTHALAACEEGLRIHRCVFVLTLSLLLASHVE